MSPHRKVDPLALRLEALRQEFDSSFARAVQSHHADHNSILCFSAEGGRFAAPLAALQSLSRMGALVPVPSRAPALLGLTVVQAKLIPVFSLARLTGASGSGAPGSYFSGSDSKWLALLRWPLPVAVALDSLDGYADPQASAPMQGATASRFVSGSVRLQDDLYALLDCASLCQEITRHSAPSMKGPPQ